MERHNNFDLLRFLAALQVAVVHATTHLQVETGAVISLLKMFPGVPIFFVISGYLVSASYERSSLRTYCVNRALRIYPALWACLAVSLASAAPWVAFTPDVFPWLIAQLTFAQFYNPEFLREYGVGVLNGSLWTIPVEIQFYVALPFIYAALRTRFSLLVAIVFLIVASRAFALWDNESLLAKLVGVSLLPYLFMFLIGVLLQRSPGFVRRHLSGRAHQWLALYIASALALDMLGFSVRGNFLNPLSAVLLALTAISAAHTNPIRIKHDLSYGLYLYHMVVINFMVQVGAANSYASVVVAMLASVAAAFGSWKLIERPALSLKNRLQPADVREMEDA